MSTLEGIIDLACSRSGSVIGTLLSPTGERLADIGTVDGRIWRVDVDNGNVPPLSARLSASTRAEAAAAQRERRGTDALSRTALAELQQQHLETIVDGLVALGSAMDMAPGATWDFRAASMPPRTGRIKGHHRCVLASKLRARGIDIMASQLERVIAAELSKVPSCVGIGYVDMQNGLILAVKTVNQFPEAVTNKLAAATAETMQGPTVTEIEQLMRDSRGQHEDGQHYFECIIARSKALNHIMIRGTRHREHACVFVCGSSAILGSVLGAAITSAKAIEAAA